MYLYVRFNTQFIAIMIYKPTHLLISKIRSIRVYKRKNVSSLTSAHELKRFLHERRLFRLVKRGRGYRCRRWRTYSTTAYNVGSLGQGCYSSGWTSSGHVRCTVYRLQLNEQILQVLFSHATTRYSFNLYL